jgi:hypothetical protein
VLATRMRMTHLDEPGRYTELSYQTVRFDLALEDRLFTLFTLRSGAVP